MINLSKNKTINYTSGKQAKGITIQEKLPIGGKASVASKVIHQLRLTNSQSRLVERSQISNQQRHESISRANQPTTQHIAENTTNGIY